MLVDSKNKCVYLHKDSEGIIRYVGSGTLKRAHLTRANSKRGKKYAEYVEANGRLEVEVVVEGLSKAQSENLERELFYKHKDTILNSRRPNSVRIMSKAMFEDYLYYDETSKSCLRWKVDRVGSNGSVTVKSGFEVGSLSKSHGYYQVRLQGIDYLAHRIVAVLHDFDLDGKLIDHIDRNRSNNKISNLRVVSPEENSKNLSRHRLSAANTSGVQGVCRDKRKSRWIATWYEDGKLKTRSFPNKKYTSSEEAFIAAIEHRRRMVELHYCAQFKE